MVGFVLLQKLLIQASEATPSTPAFYQYMAAKASYEREREKIEQGDVLFRVRLLPMQGSGASVLPATPEYESKLPPKASGTTEPNRLLRQKADSERRDQFFRRQCRKLSSRERSFGLGGALASFSKRASGLQAPPGRVRSEKSLRASRP